MPKKRFTDEQIAFALRQAEAIRDAAGTILRSGDFRVAAERLSRIVAGLDGAQTGADALEEIALNPRARHAG